MKPNRLTTLLLILPFLFFQTVRAEEQQKRPLTDASMVGHTVDRETGEHIPYISIVIKGTTISTMSDAGGHYSLRNLPTGEHIVIASGIGYKSIERSVTLESKKTIEVDFELEQDAIMLDNVVVSASRNDSNRKTTPNIVNVLSPIVFEATNSVCLSQGLNFQSGLRVETNCQNCGFQQVRINGLDGPYTQILIDSRPLFSALAGVYGLEQIPANIIERVEVVKGGGSALFGTNAIGGTINIITKEPLANSATITNNTTLIGGKNFDINNSINASIVSGNNKTGVSIFGSTRDRNGYDADGDGFTEIAKLKSKSIGFRLYNKPSIYSKISLEYHAINEFRRGGDSISLPAHHANIAEQLDHDINSGNIKVDLFSKDFNHHFTLFASGQYIDRKSYYGAEKNPDAYGSTTDLSFVGGAQYSYKMEKFLFLPAIFTAGSEISYNKLADNQLGYNRIIDQKVSVISAFAQNEWKDDAWTLLLGLRADKHQLLKNLVISPRVNLRYMPAKWVHIRGGFATGFRAPQAFDEDLHVASVGGEIQIIKLDPNLKPEHSQSYTLSLDLYKEFGSLLTNLLIDGFYNKISNIFALTSAGNDPAGHKIMMRVNESGAVVKGINFEARLVPSKKLQFQLGYTLQESLYDEARSWSESGTLAPRRKIFRAPNHYGYLTGSYAPTKAIGISLSGTYTGKMLVQHITESGDFEKVTPRFLDANFKFSYDIPLADNVFLQLNAGVQNIFNSYQKDFDKGVTRDAGYIYGPSLPRSLFVGAKLKL